MAKIFCQHIQSGDTWLMAIANIAIQRFRVDADTLLPVAFSSCKVNTSKSVVVANSLPYFCSTSDFNSSISGFVIVFGVLLFYDMLELSPVAVVSIHSLLAFGNMENASL